jgi:hypothetical protein
MKHIKSFKFFENMIDDSYDDSRYFHLELEGISLPYVSITNDEKHKITELGFQIVNQRFNRRELIKDNKPYIDWIQVFTVPISDLVINIYAHDDEWYEAEVDSDLGMSIYLCDQMEGLIYFLKKIKKGYPFNTNESNKNRVCRRCHSVTNLLIPSFINGDLICRYCKNDENVGKVLPSDFINIGEIEIESENPPLPETTKSQQLYFY